ncbi:MAG: helix-turn-helix domain-containing protein [Armatimonadetes bacterium]|nr:helix-turn-helix domain-containing protein [Armatimonadota bacterium]
MSQAELASALGVSRDLIANYENGRTEPPAHIIRKVSKLWRIRESWFWDQAEEDLPGNAKPIDRPNEPLINLAPYWGQVPCGDWQAPDGDGDWLQISDAIDPGGVVAVKVAGYSMAPRLLPGQVVTVRLSKEPREGVISLAANGQKELTLKVLKRIEDEWVLESVNPAYGAVSADSWEILGYAVAVEDHSVQGIRP